LCVGVNLWKKTFYKNTLSGKKKLWEQKVGENFFRGSKK